ncbi:GntR family transcriptional regulator [uncultured Roseibium sp.]|uniref:GntR family transcriptional regulator n=1 Tax=uncultured Roseibium sp. TaxID=1936171 RepID=UPI00321800BD
MNFESVHLLNDLGNAVENGQGERIKRISVSQQIQDSLRARIVSLELAPGQNLSRSDIATHYGVSQTPVRDAMMKLEEEGLLTIYPQSKTEVSKIDVEHARETQTLRLSLELEVCRRLAKSGDPKAIDQARKILHLQETALSDGDLGLFSMLDKRFHLSLFQAVGIANLWQLVASRSGHIDRLRNLNLPDPGKAANILHYHRLILDAIESGNVQATDEAVRSHLSGTLETVDQIVARNPDYF